MKSTGIWGLDIADGRLRMVHLARAGRRPRLTHAISIDVAADTGDEQLSDLLRRAVDGSGIASQHVAICLPTTAGYVRCHEADGEAVIAADEGFVSDSWTVVDGDTTLTVTGVADRRQADRLIRVAGRAGLHVVHVALPQVAAAAALGVLDNDTGPDRRAGFVVDHGQVRFTLARRQALLLTRSTPRAIEAGATMDLAQIAAAVYRAAQIAEPGGLPAEVSVIAGDGDFVAIEPMADAVGVVLHRIRPGDTIGLVSPDDPAGDISEYAVPVGTALLAAGRIDRKLDLRAALIQPETPHSRAWRRLSVAVAAVVTLAAIGLFAAEWIPKRMELARLRRRYEAQRPLLERQAETEETWQLLRPWLSTTQEGERIEHLRILESITEVFPGAADAYVTDMSVDVPRIGGDVDISLVGRAVSSEILYACMARLNDLGRFDTQLVRLSDVEQALAYPKKYVIPIAMKGAGDARESP